jgi:REP element-mobilizing transposase RayT
MSDKFQHKYRIPSVRLNDWDYRREGFYFITICTKGRQCDFGKIIDDKMELSGAGVLADVLWHEIKNHASNVELGEFVVMPNHIHGILKLTNADFESESGSVETLHATSLQTTPTSVQPVVKNIQMAAISPKKGSVSVIVRSYKSAVSHHARRLGFELEWQERFHDHVIRGKEEYQRIAEYIVQNPAKWEEDKFYNE